MPPSGVLLRARLSMLGSYRTALRAALDERRAAPTVSLRVPSLLVVTTVTLSVVAAIVFASPTHASSQFQEGGIVTVVSALCLGAAAAFAAATYFFCDRSRRGQWFWWLSGLGFAFFALDELLQFHEGIGFALGDGEGAGPPGFRSWNDIVVILYGLIAAVVCLSFLPEILRTSGFAPIVALAGGAYVLHTAIDSVFTRSDRSVMAEESAKLSASALFALAFFAALSATVALRIAGAGLRPATPRTPAETSAVGSRRDAV